MVRHAFCLCSIMLLAVSVRAAGVGGEGAYIIVLRYPKSFAVRIYENKEHHIIGVIYKVKLDYPSRQVLRFYDDKLGSMGWVPYSNPWFYGDLRKWRQSLYAEAPGSPLVNRLNAWWISRNKSELAFLQLRYFSTKMSMREKELAHGPDNDVQNIELQVIPASEESPIPKRGSPVR